MNQTVNNTGTLVYLPLEKLEHHPDNPRKVLGDLTELTDSIRKSGVLQNLTVVPVEDGAKYYVVIGNRRMEASKAAGLTEVPCVIAQMTKQEQVATMFVENVQRADLTPYEQAECLQMMLDLGETQESVAKQTGLSEKTVSRRLRLLKLDKKRFDKSQERGGASLEQYIKIAEVKSASDRKELLDAVGTDNFNSKYQRVLKDQVVKELTPKVLKEVSAFAKEAPEGTYSWSAGYQTEKSCRIEQWKPGTLTIKKPKKDAQYFYLFSYGTVYILRKKEAENVTPQKISEKEKAARKRRRELKKITGEMYQLRRDFMMNFSAGLKNKDILLEWALVEIVGTSAGRLYKTGNFDKKPLHEKIGQDPKRTYDVEKEKLKAFYDKDPGAALALIIYCNSGDREDSGYYYEGYGETMPHHQKNQDLDVVYDYLGRLGYRMCDEEKQLQDGSHPLFVCGGSAD